MLTLTAPVVVCVANGAMFVNYSLAEEPATDLHPAFLRLGVEMIDLSARAKLRLVTARMSVLSIAFRLRSCLPHVSAEEMSNRPTVTSLSHKGVPNTILAKQLRDTINPP